MEPIFQGTQPLGFEVPPMVPSLAVAGLLLVPVLSLTGLEVLSRWGWRMGNKSSTSLVTV